MLTKIVSTMPRIARLVVPGHPHHVTQRGNRKQRTFFSNQDYAKYIDLVSVAKAQVGAEILAYCLMPNHVHMIVIPQQEDSLFQLFKESHRRYTLRVNKAHGWRGHLWQERYYSVVMDEPHLFAAVRYVELNPVRAHLCHEPEDWPWSSARAHLSGTDDSLVSVAPMLDRIEHWKSYLSGEEETSVIERIRKHSRTGRPVGTEEFIARLEEITGRELKPRESGRKPNR